MPASYARSRLLGFALMAVGLGLGAFALSRMGDAVPEAPLPTAPATADAGTSPSLPADAATPPSPAAGTLEEVEHVARQEHRYPRLLALARSSDPRVAEAAGAHLPCEALHTHRADLERTAQDADAVTHARHLGTDPRPQVRAVAAAVLALSGWREGFVLQALVEAADTCPDEAARTAYATLVGEDAAQGPLRLAEPQLQPDAHYLVPRLTLAEGAWAADAGPPEGPPRWYGWRTTPLGLALGEQVAVGTTLGTHTLSCGEALPAFVTPVRLAPEVRLLLTHPGPLRGFAPAAPALAQRAGAVLHAEEARALAAHQAQQAELDAQAAQEAEAAGQDAGPAGGPCGPLPSWKEPAQTPAPEVRCARATPALDWLCHVHRKVPVGAPQCALAVSAWAWVGVRGEALVPLSVRAFVAGEREANDGESPVAVLPAQGKVSVLAEPRCDEGCAGLHVYELRDHALVQVADAKALRCED